MMWPFFKKKPQNDTDFGKIRSGLRIYAIGDIHGRVDLLNLLLEQIQRDIDERPCVEPIVIFLGDYVDRGPSSADVIERLVFGELPGKKHYFLRGNHEQMFLEFLDSPTQTATWLEFGGNETAFSYGAGIARKTEPSGLAKFSEALNQLVHESHKIFLGSLIDFVEFDGYYFVHAGVRPGVALSQQKASDQLWIRDAFLNHDHNFEKVIVHGHTPREQPENLPGRINVDTGAYATHKLTAVVLEADNRSFLTSEKNSQQYEKLTGVSKLEF